MEITFVAQPYNDAEFETGMRDIGRIGYTRVELKDRRIRTFGVPEIKRILSAANLGVIQINTYFNVVQGEKAIEQSLALNDEVMDYALKLNAPFIRVFTGPLSKEGISSANASPEIWKEATEALALICDQGAEHGLTYLVETHIGTLADTTPSILKLIELIDSPNFGVNLQIPLFEEPDVYATIRELAPYVRHTHLNNFEISGHNTFLSEGVFDIRREIELLHNAGFNGALSVEHAYHHTPITDVAQREFTFLANLLRDFK